MPDRDQFERAWGFLEPARAHGGEHTKESVWAALNRGTRDLWLGDDSAGIAEMVKYPSGLTVVNGWLAGGRLEEILEVWFPMIEAWGRDHGATEIRVNGRRGWLRMSGYKEFRTAIRKDLSNV